MANYPTPHINAVPEDFAKTVLMPGDPLRAKFVADNYLTDAKLVNNVRGVQGYTGFYRGVKVSVMASGMGMPSIGIYSHELYNFFGVENIIRIGSAGGIGMDVHVHDIVLGMGASTDSNFASQFHLPGTFAPICSYKLLKTCTDVSEELGYPCKVGGILSSDAFYGDTVGLTEAQHPNAMWSKMGVLAVEMEAAALYMNAARYGKNALCICTISDHIITGESLSAEDRQTSFRRMMELALETAVKLDKENN